jgi:hypothetical protein
MAGSSSQQPNFDAILELCDKATKLTSKLLETAQTLDAANIALYEFSDMITRTIGYTQGHEHLGQLEGKLRDLQGTLHAYEKLAGYKYWMQNRDTLDDLREHGAVIEGLVRGRASKQQPPDAAHYLSLLEFNRKASKALEGVKKGSNVIYKDILSKGAEILNKEFARYKRTFGSTEIEVSFSVFKPQDNAC